jgi:hypothetical protein
MKKEIGIIRPLSSVLRPLEQRRAAARARFAIQVTRIKIILPSDADQREQRNRGPTTARA